MAGLVLMFMVAVMVVVLFFRLVMQKPVKKYLLASSIILGSYLVTVSCTCGPNPKDVAVMKPMAEAISNYIVKHGIPESLEDIPDLPYELEGCSKPQENVKDCTFSVKDYRYSLELYRISTLYITIQNKDTETGIHYKLRRKNKEGQWFLIEEKSFSSKTSGICNPMRM